MSTFDALTLAAWKKHRTVDGHSLAVKQKPDDGSYNAATGARTGLVTSTTVTGLVCTRKPVDAEVASPDGGDFVQSFQLLNSELPRALRQGDSITWNGRVYEVLAPIAEYSDGVVQAKCKAVG